MVTEFDEYKKITTEKNARHVTFSRIQLCRLNFKKAEAISLFIVQHLFPLSLMVSRHEIVFAINFLISIEAE